MCGTKLRGKEEGRVRVREIEILCDLPHLSQRPSAAFQGTLKGDRWHRGTSAWREHVKVERKRRENNNKGTIEENVKSPPPST